MSKGQSRVAGGAGTQGASESQLSAAAAAAQAAVGGTAPAGAPVITEQPAAPAVKVPFQATLTLDTAAPVRGSGRRFQRNWFLKREDDLAVVTSEPSNEALGIINLTLQAPTVNQKASGIICKVAMETLTGWDYGITIWESKENAGDIMLMVGGARKIEATPEQKAAGKKDDFIRDRKLNDATTAQILSFVWSHLRPVQQ